METQEDVTGWLKSWLNYFRNISPNMVRDWKIWKELDCHLGKYNLKFRHKGTELIKKIARLSITIHWRVMVLEYQGRHKKQRRRIESRMDAKRGTKGFLWPETFTSTAIALPPPADRIIEVVSTTAAGTTITSI